MERIAIAVGAAYGAADSAACAEQIMRTPEDVAQNPEIADIPGFRIYPLRRARVFGLDASGAPVQMRLSWLNYWSDAVARALGFPNPVRDRPLEGLYERIGDRGWLVALTQAPPRSGASRASRANAVGIRSLRPALIKTCVRS